MIIRYKNSIQTMIVMKREYVKSTPSVLNKTISRCLLDICIYWGHYDEDERVIRKAYDITNRDTL
jgi:hypothetical protein